MTRKCFFTPATPGIGHSTLTNFVDPTYARFASVLPFAQWGLSPVAQNYMPVVGGIY
jgi:hypothetical protein